MGHGPVEGQVQSRESNSSQIKNANGEAHTVRGDGCAAHNKRRPRSSNFVDAPSRAKPLKAEMRFHGVPSVDFVPNFIAGAGFWRRGRSQDDDGSGLLQPESGFPPGATGAGHAGHEAASSAISNCPIIMRFSSSSQSATWGVHTKAGGGACICRTTQPAR